MDFKLEVVPIPVTDIDRAKAFYERWGFVPVGTEAFLLGTDEQTDVLMQLGVNDRTG